MTFCKEQSGALIECAREGRKPAPGLLSHLKVCAACEERWQSELALTEQFRGMRTQAMAADAASQARRDLHAAALLRRVEQRRPVTLIPIRSVSWKATWVLSAAAAVLLAIGVGYGAGARARRAHNVRNDQAVIYEASAELSGGDFIAIPYALPVVPGEVVDVEQSDLGPQDLANMGLINLGLDVDDDADVSADVVVGQDGLPRAVRINYSTQFQKDIQ
jgi:hypothetical protein